MSDKKYDAVKLQNLKHAAVLRSSLRFSAFPSGQGFSV